MGLITTDKDIGKNQVDQRIITLKDLPENQYYDLINNWDILNGGINTPDSMKLTEIIKNETNKIKYRDIVSGIVAERLDSYKRLNNDGYKTDKEIVDLSHLTAYEIFTLKGLPDNLRYSLINERASLEGGIVASEAHMIMESIENKINGMRDSNVISPNIEVMVHTYKKLHNLFYNEVEQAPKQATLEGRHWIYKVAATLLGFGAGLAGAMCQGNDITVHGDIVYPDGTGVNNSTFTLQDPSTEQSYSADLVNGQCTINLATDIDKNYADKAEFGNVFPNPSNQDFNLSFKLTKQEDVYFGIYNNEGKLIGQFNAYNLAPGKYNLGVEGLNKGTYTVKSWTNTQKSSQNVVSMNDRGSEGDLEWTLKQAEQTIHNQDVSSVYTKKGKVAGSNVNVANSVMDGNEYELNVKSNLDPEEHIELNETLELYDGMTVHRTVYENGAIKDTLLTAKEGSSILVAVKDIIYTPNEDGVEVYVSSTNPDINIEHVGDSVKITAPENYNGTIPLEVFAKLVHGTELEGQINAIWEPMTKVSGELLDVVTGEPYVGKVMFNDKVYNITESDSGIFDVKLDPDQYTVFKTDTANGKMQTYWDLGIIGNDDFDLGKIPYMFKHDDVTLLIDIIGGYGESDRNTYATNKIWNPNIQHEGLEKGTLKTLDNNYKYIEDDPVRKTNFDWVINLVNQSAASNPYFDNKVRLQMPSEATVVDIPVSSEFQEDSISAAFARGLMYPDHDAMPFLVNYTANSNGTNASLVNGYTTKGDARIRWINLLYSRAYTLSEITTMLQNTGDITPAREHLVEGTMYGDPLLMNHEIGYIKNRLYGPPGKQIMLSLEEYIGRTKMGLPVNTLIVYNPSINLSKIILPARNQSF